MVNKRITIILIIFSFFLMSNIYSQNKLNPQVVIFDPPTAHTLSMVVPTIEGDANRNGTIEVFFREKGKSEFEKNWRPEIMERRLLEAHMKIAGGF